MAKEALQSSLSSFQYSTVSVADIATNGKTIVCLKQIQWPTSADVSEEDTFCGGFSSIGNASHEITGNGVNVGNKAANEASVQDLKILMQAKTKVFFILKNAATGNIDEGEIAYADGSGYFTQADATFEHPGLAGFDWGFKPDGASINLVPPAE